MVLDIIGALWVMAVVAVFLGGAFGLPEASVVVLEKVYAVLLMVGVVWLARQVSKGATKRD